MRSNLALSPELRRRESAKLKEQLKICPKLHLLKHLTDLLDEQEFMSQNSVKGSAVVFERQMGKFPAKTWKIGHFSSFGPVFSFVLP